MSRYLTICAIAITHLYLLQQYIRHRHAILPACPSSSDIRCFLGFVGFIHVCWDIRRVE